MSTVSALPNLHIRWSVSESLYTTRSPVAAALRWWSTALNAGKSSTLSHTQHAHSHHTPSPVSTAWVVLGNLPQNLKAVALVLARHTPYGLDSLSVSNRYQFAFNFNSLSILFQFAEAFVANTVPDPPASGLARPKAKQGQARPKAERSVDTCILNRVAVEGTPPRHVRVAKVDDSRVAARRVGPANRRAGRHLETGEQLDAAHDTEVVDEPCLGGHATGCGGGIRSITGIESNQIDQ